MDNKLIPTNPLAVNLSYPLMCKNQVHVYNLWPVPLASKTIPSRFVYVHKWF